MRIARLVVLVAFVGCAANRYTVGQYTDVTHYEIATTYRTASGIYVDDPKRELFPRIIDKMVLEVEACIAGLPAKWTQAEMGAGNCLVEDVPRSIRRDWLVVKAAPDWFVSKCTGEQIFACDVDPRLCDEKLDAIGQPRDPACACGCRATIQAGIVVTTPNMKLFKAEVARLVTGCNNVWFGQLNECVHTPAYPLVDPGAPR